MIARAIFFKEEAGKKTYFDPGTNVYWEV